MPALDGEVHAEPEVTPKARKQAARDELSDTLKGAAADRQIAIQSAHDDLRMALETADAECAQVTRAAWNVYDEKMREMGVVNG
jgi:hypothetical protein